MHHNTGEKALLSSVPADARLTISHVNLVYQMGMNLPSPVLRGVLKNPALSLAEGAAVPAAFPST